MQPHAETHALLLTCVRLLFFPQSHKLACIQHGGKRPNEIKKPCLKLAFAIEGIGGFALRGACLGFCFFVTIGIAQSPSNMTSWNQDSLRSVHASQAVLIYQSNISGDNQTLANLLSSQEEVGHFLCVLEHGELRRVCGVEGVCRYCTYSIVCYLIA